MWFSLFFLELFDCKIFTDSMKFLWRKGHTGSEFSSQYWLEREKRKHFLTDWKLFFGSVGARKKRVIIQSHSNIDLMLVLEPQTSTLTTIVGPIVDNCYHYQTVVLLKSFIWTKFIKKAHFVILFSWASLMLYRRRKNRL